MDKWQDCWPSFLYNHITSLFCGTYFINTYSKPPLGLEFRRMLTHWTWFSITPSDSLCGCLWRRGEPGILSRFWPWSDSVYLQWFVCLLDKIGFSKTSALTDLAPDAVWVIAFGRWKRSRPSLCSFARKNTHGGGCISVWRSTSLLRFHLGDLISQYSLY